MTTTLKEPERCKKYPCPKTEELLYKDSFLFQAQDGIRKTCTECKEFEEKE